MSTLAKLDAQEGAIDRVFNQATDDDRRAAAIDIIRDDSLGNFAIEIRWLGRWKPAHLSGLVAMLREHPGEVERTDVRPASVS